MSCPNSAYQKPILSQQTLLEFAHELTDNTVPPTFKQIPVYFNTNILGFDETILGGVRAGGEIKRHQHLNRLVTHSIQTLVCGSHSIANYPAWLDLLESCGWVLSEANSSATQRVYSPTLIRKAGYFRTYHDNVCYLSNSALGNFSIGATANGFAMIDCAFFSVYQGRTTSPLVIVAEERDGCRLKDAQLLIETPNYSITPVLLGVKIDSNIERGPKYHSHNSSNISRIEYKSIHNIILSCTIEEERSVDWNEIIDEGNGFRISVSFVNNAGERITIYNQDYSAAIPTPVVLNSINNLKTIDLQMLFCKQSDIFIKYSTN